MVAGRVAARARALAAVLVAEAVLVQVLEAVRAPEVVAEAALVKAPEAAAGQALAKAPEAAAALVKAPAPAEAPKATRTLNKASDSDRKGWFGTDANHLRLYESARQIA